MFLLNNVLSLGACKINGIGVEPCASHARTGEAEAGYILGSKESYIVTACAAEQNRTEQTLTAAFATESHRSKPESGELGILMLETPMKS